MPIKRASAKAKSDNVFGQARKPPRMFRAALYARVSTDDQQTLSMQSRAMREYAARRGWTIALQVREVKSGAAQREARERLLKAARRREIDLVLVWRLDRWGRSVTDLLATLQELEHLGVGFVSLTEALDLTTPAGRAMAGLLAIFAEFEREILRERTRAGLAQARLNGKRLGRPVTAGLHAAEIRKLHSDGISKSEIARRVQIGRTSVRRIINAHTSSRKGKDEMTESNALTAASPTSLAIYKQLLAKLAPVGPFREEIKKTSIHLARKSAFAGVHPRSQHLLLTIKAEKPIRSPRVTKAEQVSKSRWHLDVKVSNIKEIDGELLGWLRRAYDLCA